MSVSLEQICADVIGSAEADPEAAPEIYTDAAERFREFARQEEFARVAASLAARANEFESRARTYLHLRLVQRRSTKDDFEEQEDELAQAHHEVGHLDDLEIRARRNEIRDRLHGKTHVSIAPESVTEKTALGRQINAKFNPTTADVINNIVSSDTVILWQGTKTESQAFTVDVGVPKVPTIGTTVSCRPYGIVTYGADGFQMNFTFDVGLGVRLTGVGNYCSVLVGMGAPKTGAASGVMSIGASLGFFAAPSQAPVTFTSYIDSLAASAATAAILRPARAQSILPPQASDTSGSTQIDFLDYASATMTSLLFGNGLIVNPIPLTAEIAAVVVTNRGAVVGNFRLPWMLST